jgi:3alpha(or 20beta)-hydroxysteroid dehydrogenase
LEFTIASAPFTAAETDTSGEDRFMAQLTGKVAVITGAARGQGAAEARLFVAEGAKVVLTDVNLEGESVAAELGHAAMFVRHDVSKDAEWADVMARTLSHFGRLDILVNNAGVYSPATLRETDDALWDRFYRINQLGVFLGMRAVLEPMITSGGGSIVNIASAAALGANPGMFAYGSSKWAVRGMTKLAAAEFGPLGIRVNGVYPGMIDTPMIQVNDPEVLKTYAARIAMGRMGRADEVAKVVMFLASDASSYMTGAELAVDGGIGT